MKTTKIQGCDTVDVFQVLGEGRNQYIICIGENHDLKGNTLELLQWLSKEIDCSVDILVEKGFQELYTAKSDWGDSLVGAFHKPPLQTCTTPVKIPSKKEILEKKQEQDFYKDCIFPYEGKIKIYGIDLRKVTLFFTLHDFSSRVADEKFNNEERKIIRELRTNQHFRNWFDLVLNAQRSILDVDLFLQNRSVYDQKVKKAIYEVYVKSPPELKQYIDLGVIKFNPKTKGSFDEYFEKILNFKRDKTHLRFMEDLVNLFSMPILDKFFNVLSITLNDQQPMWVLMSSAIMDLETIFRIHKILAKKKEGFIFVIAGNAHTLQVSRMLDLEHTSYSTPRGSEYTIQYIGTLDCDPYTYDTELDLHNIHCFHQSDWMKIFKNYQKEKVVDER